MTTTNHDLPGPGAGGTATPPRHQRRRSGATAGAPRPAAGSEFGAVRPDRAAACILTASAPQPDGRPRFDRARLVELMAAMANGDAAATFALSREFGGPLSAVVRVELRRRNVQRVDDDDLAGMVLDASLALASVAGAWDPNGALPWHWARPRVAAVVDAWVGQFTDEWDPDRHVPVPGAVAEAWTGPEPTMLAVLEGLAGRHPAIALLAEALAKVGSDRDQELLLAYVVQQQAGDPSPAVTLSLLTGRSPDAVRQAVSRVRRSLRQLVADDPRYAVLEGLPLVA